MSNNIWPNFYSTIAQVNLILNSENYINLTHKENVIKWEEVKGECYALKAMIYLNLLNIYSNRYADDNLGIVLKDKVGPEKKKRASQKECINEINFLLNNALKLLSNKPRSSFYYLDYNSVLLLSARAALFSNNYIEAVSYCDELIKKAGYKDETPDLSSYKDMWFKRENTYSYSSERLFAFNIQAFIFTQFTGSKELGDIVAVHPSFDYTTEDIRYSIASIPFTMKSNASITIVRNLIGKYRTSVSDREYYPYNVLRIAEAYFILSECYFRLKNEAKARETLNFFLKKKKCKYGIKCNFGARSFK